MRLTVLGKSPSWQDAGGACSSYLVEEGDATILIDCGSGSFGKLRARRDHRDVDAVVLSHLHADHVLDLIPFACALTYGPAAAEGLRPPRLAGTAGVREHFAGLGAAIGDPDLIVEAFAIEEYVPGSPVEVGPLAVTPHVVRHSGPTHALALAAPSGGRIVFGADGRYSEELVAAAEGADVLLAEATLPDPDSTQDVHMSAEETGRLAEAAGVGRLVLTHISDELDTERSLERAAAGFSGPVEIAVEGASYEV
jgi:ribonuclease BN (tRNA processing enzyme)